MKYIGLALNKYFALILGPVRKVITRRPAFFLLLLFALYAFAYRTLLNAGPIFYGDFPFVFNPWIEIQRYLSLWQPYNLGSPEATHVNQVFFGVLGIFGPGALKYLSFAILPLSGITSLLFFRAYLGDRLASYLGAFVYSINPLTISEFNGGGLNVLWGYMLAPITILSFKSKKGMGTIIYSLSLLLWLMSLMNWENLIIMFPLIALFGIFQGDKKMNAIRNVLILAGGYSLVFLFYMPWLIFVALLGQTLVSSDAILRQMNYLYSACTPFYTLRLTAAPVYSAAWLLGYADGMQGALGFFITSLFGFSLLLGRSRKLIRELIVPSVLLIIFITLFVWLTNLRLTYDLFRMFPYLFTFRQCTKMLYPIALPFSVLTALAFNNIFATLDGKLSERKISIIRHAMIVGFVVLVITHNSPILAGDMGLPKTQGPYTVPTAYLEAAKWIENRRALEGWFRTLWFPLDSRLIYHLDQYPLYVVHTDVLEYRGLTSTLPFALFDVIAQNKTDQLGILLSLFGVKYIVVVKSAGIASIVGASEGQIRRVGNWLLGNPSNFESILKHQKDLQLIHAGNNFTIYQNLAFRPFLVNNRLFIIYSDNTSEPILDPLISLLNIPGFNFSNTTMIRYEDFTHEIINQSYQITLINYNTFASPPDMTKTLMDQIYIWQFEKVPSVIGSSCDIEKNDNASYDILLSCRTPLNFILNIESQSGKPFKNILVGLRLKTRAATSVGFNNVSVIADSRNLTWVTAEVGKAPINITITSPISGSVVYLDMGLIIESRSKLASLEEYFSSPPIPLSVNRAQITKYEFNLTSKQPIYLSIFQSYDPGFQGLYGDGHLFHFRAYEYANGFVVPSGQHLVKISFSPNALWEIALTLQLLTGIGAFIVLPTMLIKRRKTKRPIQKYFEE